MRNSKTNSDRIDAQESDYLYVGKSQLPDSGDGLYTAIKIYKDEIVAVYNGEILTVEQAKQRAEKGTDKYFIDLSDRIILDSMNVLCFAKYANDANAYKDSDFKNNAKIAFDDDSNVCLIAIRNLKPDEEIFCSYGKRYWKKHG